MASGIAVIALVSSPVASARSSARTRREARADRLWERRAKLYVDLLAWAIGQRELARQSRDDWADEARNMPEMDPAALVALEAEAAAFASDSVDAQVDKISRPWNQLRLAWGDLDLLHDRTVNGPALRESFRKGGQAQPEERVATLGAEVVKWADELTAMIRRELGTCS